MDCLQDIPICDVRFPLLHIYFSKPQDRIYRTNKKYHTFRAFLDLGIALRIILLKYFKMELFLDPNFNL